MTPKRILVALDWSDYSKHALRMADELAVQGGASLTLLHVVPFAVPALLDVTLVMPPSALSKLTTDAQRQLEQLALELETPRERVSLAAVPGDPPLVLVDESADYDLLVLGTHGRTGVTRWLLGSVAERVARGARCAVLIARPKGTPAARARATPESDL